jgi:glycosyltransferase involved in cell wall biosynthesis
MKILQVIQKSQFRGAEIFACQLSVELKKLGHEVDVLFLFGDKDEVLPYPLDFIHLKGSIKNRFWDFKAYKRLNRIIRAGKYDVVQANAADTLKYNAISKFLYRWKAKLVYRNANKMGDFLDSYPKKILNRFFVSQVDGVASVSELCKVDFLAQFPNYKKPIDFLPIGITCKSSSSYKSFEQASLILPKDAMVFVHVGSFVPEKNHQGLVAIFEKYLQHNKKALLLFIGEGKLKKVVEQVVKDKQLEKNILFLGKRSDVLELLPLCYGFLLPSLIEGLPGVILEAMYSKTPVIAYDVGGISEVLTSQTGFLIPKNDEVAFVNAMLDLDQCPHTDLVLENAYKMVIEHYNNQVLAKAFLRSYVEVCGL